jgi:hypothetical protein
MPERVALLAGLVGRLIADPPEAVFVPAGAARISTL